MALSAVEPRELSQSWLLTCTGQCESEARGWEDNQQEWETSCIQKNYSSTSKMMGARLFTGEDRKYKHGKGKTGIIYVMLDYNWRH